MSKYEYKLSDSLDEVLDWLAEEDRNLITILSGQNNYGPFFTAVVQLDEPAEKPTEFHEAPKNKGGRPKGSKNRA